MFEKENFAHAFNIQNLFISYRHNTCKKNQTTNQEEEEEVRASHLPSYKLTRNFVWYIWQKRYILLASLTYLSCALPNLSNPWADESWDFLLLMFVQSNIADVKLAKKLRVWVSVSQFWFLHFSFIFVLFLTKPNKEIKAKLLLRVPWAKLLFSLAFANWVLTFASCQFSNKFT